MAGRVVRVREISSKNDETKDEELVVIFINGVVITLYPRIRYKAAIPRAKLITLTGINTLIFL